MTVCGLTVQVSVNSLASVKFNATFGKLIPELEIPALNLIVLCLVFKNVMNSFSDLSYYKYVVDTSFPHKWSKFVCVYKIVLEPTKDEFCERRA